ncbi:MAG: hypothetical protein HQL08_13125 [Nitrospirae bacterium]|nr:hypothetical protein [Nitrospirota bacterium]
MQNKDCRLKAWNMSVFCVLTSVLSLLVLSCAPKYAERPSREGLSLSEMLSRMNSIQSIEAVLSINYEKNDAAMSGDAALNLSGDALNLRLYYLGFLAGEIKENNGIISSKPKIDKYKSIVLVDGLKNSFMWWTISDYTIQEREDSYVLKNSSREVIIGKKDLLPVKQTVEFENGEELNITYDTPAHSRPETNQYVTDPETGWYQSRLSIRYRNHLVNVKVKSYSASREKNHSLTNNPN